MEKFLMMQLALLVMCICGSRVFVYSEEQVPNKLQQIHIDKLTGEYFSIEKELWKKISTQQILLDRGSFLNEIYREHNRTESNDFGETKTIWSLGIQKYQQLINTVLSIDTNARNIKEYLVHGEYTKLMDLAKNAQMEKSFDDLHAIISDKSFWEDILANYASGQCNKYGQAVNLQNGNELIFDLYKEISTISLKSYINIQLTHMILKVTEDGAVKQKNPDELHKIFYDRYVANQLNVKALLQKASNKKWMCDKSNFPATHFKISRFYQGYIDNEINLNSDQSCRKTCNDFTQTKNYGCADGTLCAESHIDNAITRCKGTVYNCDYIDDDLTICPSTQKVETRRYDFIQYENGKTFGKYGACLQTAKTTSWNSWFVKCSSCFCYCDEPSILSDRYFSLHDVTSNVNENRIVTGVAITKRNRMLQFIIGESTLMPYGKLNTTIEYENDANKANANNRYLSHPEFAIDGKDIKAGVDYHELSYQNRAINLDTANAPAGKIVTGVRFHVLDDSRLSLQIRATDFDYETGKLLNVDKSVWISSRDGIRTELILKNPDVPTRATQPLEPNWTEKQFIKFGPTDRVKDAAQTTVPFFDGTFVEGNPTLLSGIGLYYKSQPGFGGFIAPYLNAFDFGSLINTISDA